MIEATSSTLARIKAGAGTCNTIGEYQKGSTRTGVPEGEYQRDLSTKGETERYSAVPQFL